MIALSPQTRTAFRDLLNLAWPVILSRLGIMTMGLTDAIVVGRHSSEQLAFHSLGWAPTSVLLTTAVGLLMGVQVMTARLYYQSAYQSLSRIGRGRLMMSRLWSDIKFMAMRVAAALASHLRKWFSSFKAIAVKSFLSLVKRLKTLLKK